jgi:hypothetical protein
MSKYEITSILSEAADWNLFDANVHLGPSGVHGELSVDTSGLLGEMDRYFIKSALVSHWTAEEYDAAVGNDALERDLHHRFTPAWSMVPDDDFLQTLSSRSVSAVRLTPTQHNFSLDTWCAGPMLDFLQQNAIVTLIARSAIAWSDIATLLENFPRLPLVLLDTGYRSDRYLFPLLKKFPSLFFDSATYLAHRQLEYFVEKHGPDRILFGSRLPLFTPAAAMGVLASARIADSAKQQIAGGNLRQLLNCAVAQTRVGS